jgi:Tfp pilus assembly protein FimT
VFVILGAAVVPSLSGMMGDTNVKGAADLCMARLSDARSYAIEEGRAYRVSVSPDGKQIRISPDEADGSGQPLVAPEIAAHTITDHLIDTDRAQTVVITPGSNQRDGGDGWIVLATYLPDGTCREANSKFSLNEAGSAAYTMNVRGLTGAVTLNQNKPGSQ